MVEEQILLIVLAGVVGSGKSTFASSLSEKLGYKRINQDELGDRKTCEEILKSALAAGKNVVIDRQNFDQSQRKVWLEIGNEFPSVSIRCLVMGTTREECKTRLRQRINHPTIDNPTLALSLLEKFLNLWEQPQLDEGFDKLLVLPSLPVVIPTRYLELLLAELESSPTNLNAAKERSQGKKVKKSSYAPPRAAGPLANTSSDAGAAWRAAQAANASPGGGAWNWQGK